ncbi:hypothetical protein NDU88_001839 [Pleurodeles waltl]|uniref:Uncharacterized protein n=1 Tax=Pleurodeles waltl TaxID=8319 RepID=A0AAV7P8B9_PLEWA|nr:hypothetical protein NDU88_001839 [Pleurodeles waltl]
MCIYTMEKKDTAVTRLAPPTDLYVTFAERDQLLSSMVDAQGAHLRRGRGTDSVQNHGQSKAMMEIKETKPQAKLPDMVRTTGGNKTELVSVIIMECGDMAERRAFQCHP